MTTIKFYKHNDGYNGVVVSGHSGYSVEGSDIVCAAITSAVRLCECAITDVIGVSADVSVNEKKAEIKILLPKKITDDEYSRCLNVLKAFKIHASALAEEYPQFITVSEV